MYAGAPAAHGPNDLRSGGVAIRSCRQREVPRTELASRNALDLVLLPVGAWQSALGSGGLPLGHVAVQGCRRLLEHEVY